MNNRVATTEELICLIYLALVARFILFGNLFKYFHFIFVLSASLQLNIRKSDIMIVMIFVFPNF